MPDSQNYPWNHYLIHYVRNTVVFFYWKVFKFDNLNTFSCSRNAQVTFEEKPHLKTISFFIYKHWYLIHTWSDKDFKGAVICESNISIFALRVTWNYTSSLLKSSESNPRKSLTSVVRLFWRLTHLISWWNSILQKVNYSSCDTRHLFTNLDNL